MVLSKISDMSGSADAAAAAAAGSDVSKHYRTRLSKIHEDLWSKCDRVKPVIESLARRSKDLGASQITVMGDYLEARKAKPFGPEQGNLVIAGDEGSGLNGHVTVNAQSEMTVTDTIQRFPHTTMGNTIHRYYEEHYEKLRQIQLAKDEPYSTVTPEIEVQRQNAAHKCLHAIVHEGIHQTLLQLIDKTRTSILTHEILVSRKTLVEAEPDE